MKRLLVLGLASMLTLAGFAKDIKTIVFTTQPEMHCHSCEKKIKEEIRFAKGVKKIATDVAQQTVTIEYDADKTTPEKLKESFARIGYTVTIVTPASENGQKVERR